MEKKKITSKNITYRELDLYSEQRKFYSDNNSLFILLRQDVGLIYCEFKVCLNKSYTKFNELTVFKNSEEYDKIIALRLLSSNNKSFLFMRFYGSFLYSFFFVDLLLDEVYEDEVNDSFILKKYINRILLIYLNFFIYLKFCNNFDIKKVLFWMYKNNDLFLWGKNNDLSFDFFIDVDEVYYEFNEFLGFEFSSFYLNFFDIYLNTYVLADIELLSITFFKPLNIVNINIFFFEKKYRILPFKGDLYLSYINFSIIKTLIRGQHSVKKNSPFGARWRALNFIKKSFFFYSLKNIFLRKEFFNIDSSRLSLDMDYDPIIKYNKWKRFNAVGFEKLFYNNMLSNYSNSWVIKGSINITFGFREYIFLDKLVNKKLVLKKDQRKIFYTLKVIDKIEYLLFDEINFEESYKLLLKAVEPLEKWKSKSLVCDLCDLNENIF